MMRGRVDIFVIIRIASVIARRQLDLRSNEDMKLFRSLFGVSPSTCLLLWWRIGKPPKATLKHLLWTLMFLRVYGSEANLSSRAQTSRKTYRKWVKLMLPAICTLRPALIRWSNRFRNDRGKTCKVTVDGTDFQIWQPHPFQKKWYSHKFKGPGLRYEVAICIQSGDIVWINGPYPCGSWPDIKIFRHRLKHMLRDGEKCEADQGYRGEAGKVRTPGMYVSLSDQRAKSDARARHETVNKRFKQWKALKEVYRHNLKDHQHIFTAVAVCTQLCLENGEPLYDIHY